MYFLATEKCSLFIISSSTRFCISSTFKVLDIEEHSSSTLLVISSISSLVSLSISGTSVFAFSTAATILLLSKTTSVPFLFIMFISNFPLYFFNFKIFSTRYCITNIIKPQDIVWNF